mmetsp:Transcript_12968/g.18518  ORF Transcript_12968/g.18518 Transcript_12968/m.18518 type:complete len:610 (-) Transcript_12968:168-1997(-)
MIQRKQLHRGWVSCAKVINARLTKSLQHYVSWQFKCRKVNTSSLHNLQSPTSLLKHNLLHPDDKVIWDKAYYEELQGLEKTGTWDTITEKEYLQMKHLFKGVMLTMAISTIKFDEQEKPKRAKYRIVALGNLDATNWSKEDCFAPVLSMLELRFILALAASKKCIPKSGDIAQAFVQAVLPPQERYALRPPPGCPYSPPNSYWILKRTLYGLKRSPSHFYNLAATKLQEIGLTQHPTSPCIFSRVIIPNKPPLYLGLYVDDFVYFSEDESVEKEFETRFSSKFDMDLNGPLQQFLGLKFQCHKDMDGNVTIHMGQEAFAETLIQSSNLSDAAVSTPKTPYKSGMPVDKIPDFLPESPLSPHEQASMVNLMQSYIGSLTWLSTCSRPDLSTITNILAKYTSRPTKQHIDHVKHVIKYLKGTSHLGITFSTTTNHRTVESHLNFQLPQAVSALCNANWEPQDQSHPSPTHNEHLPLFKSRSISGFLIFFHGPIHWVSKRQSLTARSSAEAEIYATDECTKSLLHLHQLISGLNLQDEIMPSPTTIYNDNTACICWSRNSTTKGLRHIQMRENAVRESVQNKFIDVQHVDGKTNLSDIFTKEDRCVDSFQTT